MYKFVELVNDEKPNEELVPRKATQLWPSLRYKITPFNALAVTGTFQDKKMFPMPWKYSMKKAVTDSKKLNNMHVMSSSHLSISKKPIVCPYTNCQKAVAVSALATHFYHDHGDVCSTSTRLEVRNRLEISLGGLKYNNIVFLMLFNILDEDDNPMIITRAIDKNIKYPTTEDPQLAAIKPILLLMATKVAPFPRKDGDEASSEMSSSNSISPIDKIFIWMASNTKLSLNYTLCLSKPDGTRRLKYFGPIPALEEKHLTLFENGQGILLSQNHILGMTKKNSELILDTMVHDAVEFGGVF